MPRLDHIRQFYQDGGYIKPAKRNPAEAVARVRAARQGFDAGGPALASGLLPLVRFTKNFVGKLPPVQQRALEEVAQHAKETGKESLRYGRLPGKDPITGSAQRGVLKPLIYGDENSVALPPSYFKFLRDTQDASGQLWTAHGHPGPRSSAVPSDITGDLGVAMNRGQGSLLFDQGIKPTSGPWQNMLITSPASNTTVKLDPMNRMFTGPNARLNDALDIQRDPMLKTLLGGDNIYGVTQDDTFRRLAALKDWSGAHGIDLPGLRDWSATRSSSPSKPPREAWMPFQQSQSARMYDALGHYGVGAEMDWKTPFANTDVTQREALPSFLNYWRRFHERPGDADYGLSQSVPERQLNLGLAPGGRVGYASKGRVLRQGVDLASKAFRDWFGKSAVVDEAGAPLLAYRGEHGAIDPAQPGAQSRLGSLSFGDRDAANTYAMSPNDHRETAQAPRVMPAYLSIKKPLPAVYDYDDPFLDIQGIENLLGRSEAERISRKFEPRITNMDLWQSDLGRHFHSVDDLIKRDPSKLGQLGFDIYSYLDDPSEVARLKAAGIDGAIHGGMGETALTREYKIFDRSQGWSPWSSKPGLQDGGRVGYASKGRVTASAIQQLGRLIEAMGKKGAPESFEAVPKLQRGVSEPERLVYPGIFQRPQDIVSQATERIVPEGEAMQRLFGHTRGSLDELNQQRVAERAGNFGEPIMAPPARARGSEAAGKLLNPRNETRINEALDEALRNPDLARTRSWYEFSPVWQRAQELGVDPEKQRFLNRSMAIMSAGSDPRGEIARGTAANWLRNQGRAEDFIKYGGVPAGQRATMAGFPADMTTLPGHAYHSTANALPWQRLLHSGEMSSDVVKTPHYAGATDPISQFTGNPVADSHFARSLGMADVRGGAAENWSKELTPAEFWHVAPWWGQKVAAAHDLEPVGAQALAWNTFGPQTGVRYIGPSKLEMLSDQIMKASNRLGVSPETARDMVISGEAGAFNRGGRATQRDYELYHTSQWQEPFAEGGKVAFPVQSRRRDYELYHPSMWQDEWEGGW